MANCPKGAGQVDIVVRFVVNQGHSDSIATRQLTAGGTVTNRRHQPLQSSFVLSDIPSNSTGFSCGRFTIDDTFHRFFVTAIQTAWGADFYRHCGGSKAGGLLASRPAAARHSATEHSLDHGRGQFQTLPAAL